MACEQCRGLESYFDQRQAERQLKGFHRRGPDKTTRMLIAALEAEGVRGLTLLDVGGGIGAVQLGLLKAGVTSATDVDASSGYLATARSEAERQGLADRIAYRHGDFTSLAAELAPAGVVTLDRVICCYHDMRALVGQSAAKAARLYGLVYPRDTWWTRVPVSLGGFFLRLRRQPFRVFVHPTAAVDALVRASGLAPRFQRNAGFWQVVVYARPA
jgi:SAM-dependent methyltransferase